MKSPFGRTERDWEKLRELEDERKIFDIRRKAIKKKKPVNERFIVDRFVTTKRG